VDGLGAGVPEPARAAVAQAAKTKVVIARVGKSETFFFIGKLLEN